MNADEIYKKYVLQEKPITIQGTSADLIIMDEVGELSRTPLPLVGGPRQSGRTTMEIRSLTPNSYFVSRTNQQSRYVMEKAYVDMVYDHIKFVGLPKYLEYRHILGTRAPSGAMVGFDHTVYEGIDSKELLDEFLDANGQYSVRGYNVKINDSVMEQLFKRYY